METISKGREKILGSFCPNIQCNSFDENYKPTSFLDLTPFLSRYQFDFNSCNLDRNFKKFWKKFN